MSPTSFVLVATAAFALLALPALASDGPDSPEGVRGGASNYLKARGDVEAAIPEDAEALRAYLKASKNRREALPVNAWQSRDSDFDGSPRAKDTLGGAASNILSDRKLGQIRGIISVLGGTQTELNRYDPASVFQMFYDTMRDGSDEPERGWLISVGMNMALAKYSKIGPALAMIKDEITQARAADPSCSTGYDAAAATKKGSRYADKFHDAGQVYLITNILKGIRTMCRFGHPDRMVEVPCVSQEVIRTVLGSADAELMMGIDGHTHDTNVVINIPKDVAERVRTTALTPYLKALILAYGQCTYNVPSRLGESMQCKPLAALLNVLGENPRTEGGLTLFWSGDVYAKPAAAGVDPNTARVISLEGSTILGKFMGNGMTAPWSMLDKIKHDDTLLCHTQGKETKRGANMLWNELSDQFATTYGPRATADGEPRGDEIVVFQDAFREGNVFMATEAPRMLLQMCALSDNDAEQVTFKFEIIRSDRCMADRIQSIEKIVQDCQSICDRKDIIADDKTDSCIAACNWKPEESGDQWSRVFHPEKFKELYSTIQTTKESAEDSEGNKRLLNLFEYMDNTYYREKQWQDLNTLQNGIYCDLVQARNELRGTVQKFNKLLKNTPGMESYSESTEECATKLVNNAFQKDTPMTIREGNLSHVSLHRGIVPPTALAECLAKRACLLSEEEESDALTTQSCSPEDKGRLSMRHADYSPVALVTAPREQIVRAVNGLYISCACAACGGAMKETNESANEYSCEFASDEGRQI